MKRHATVLLQIVGPEGFDPRIPKILKKNSIMMAVIVMMYHSMYHGLGHTYLPEIIQEAMILS